MMARSIGSLIVALLCTAALLAGCASRVSVSTHEPASDRVLSLPADARVAVIADAAGNDEGDIPDCVREHLQEAMPALQLVVAHDFRRMAGPRFSTTPKTVDEVTTVVADPAVQAEARRLALRYLVIVGGKTDSDDHSPLRYGYPATAVAKRTRVEARAWDIPGAEYIGEFAVEAWGTTASQFMMYSFAATEGAACERVAELLARRFELR